jgi:hypothetical protein
MFYWNTLKWTLLKFFTILIWIFLTIIYFETFFGLNRKLYYYPVNFHSTRNFFALLYFSVSWTVCSLVSAGLFVVWCQLDCV